MSKHGPRYTTTFSNEETASIQGAIRALAFQHNKLVRLTDIDIVEWRHVIVPPELRELSLQVDKHYGGAVYSVAYECFVSIPRTRWQASVGEPLYEFGGKGANGNSRIYFEWLGAKVDRFAMPSNYTPVLLGDRYPKLVRQIEENIREWLVSATNYGLVLDVFNWLNDFCDKGDRQHARGLMPGLVPLIGKFNKDLARRLAAPSSAARRPVPEDRLAGVQRANQIISEGLKLPETVPVSTSAVDMSLINVSSSSYSDWPARFDPIVDLS